MARTLANPETLTGRLYLPDGEIHELPYVPTRQDFQCMDLALKEAKQAADGGNPAVGAVIVTGNTGNTYSAHSTELSDKDLRNHAEMNAYGQAQPEVGTDMSGTMWYTTVEPCSMCLSPIIQGDVGVLHYAVDRNDAPDFFREKAIVLDTLLRDAGRTILVVAGLRRAESLDLLTSANKHHTSAQPKRQR